MIKRDTLGKIQLYVGNSMMLLCFLFLLYATFTVLQVYWDISGLFGNIIGIILLFASAAGTLYYPFYFLKQLRQWKRVEQARMMPDELPLYEPQPSCIMLLHSENIPPALKKSLPSRPFTFVSIFLFALCFTFFFFVVFIVLTQPDGQYINTNQLLAVWFLFPLGFLLFSLLITAFMAITAYERIEASEQGFFIQKGIRRSFVPWEEARLFAVGWREERNPEWFELSSPTALVRWPCKVKVTKESFSINSGSGSSPIVYKKVSPKEYQQELNHLASYVAMKTQLPLRDLRYPLNKG